MEKQFRPYIYHESTTGMCPTCLCTLEAKVIVQDNKAYLHKHCPEHGFMSHLLEEDAEFYTKQFLYSKAGTISKTQTQIKKGCPYDCGLCPMHEQHTCIALIEITKQCNLRCPVCYANAGEGTFLPLPVIESMMDFYQETEFGLAELLQLSGGEPTLHPNIIPIIQMAQAKKIKYVMLNTNGIRLAQDEGFVEQLSQFSHGFEVYLQFDGFKSETSIRLRGSNIIDIKKQAIKNLQKYQIPTTLVATIEKGVNEDEIGAIVEFGMNHECIRGINFQPVTFFGRLPSADIDNRITLTGIIDRIEKQTNHMLVKNDFLPLPCHPERVAFTYLYRSKDGFTPVTRNIDVTKYLPYIHNTFTFMPEDFIKQASKGCDCTDLLKQLRHLIPAKFLLSSQKERAKHLNQNTFRISVVSFIDAYNFESKAMKKECVHIITPDLKKIPFSSYNLIHRAKYDPSIS